MLTIDMNVLKTAQNSSREEIYSKDCEQAYIKWAHGPCSVLINNR